MEKTEISPGVTEWRVVGPWIGPSSGQLADHPHCDLRRNDSGLMVGVAQDRRHPVFFNSQAQERENFPRSLPLPDKIYKAQN